jgi:hypothetical protein
MTTRVETPQSRCRVGFARADVTPPVGIYHRMWGAAPHDRSTGVHRPLTATALWLAPPDGPERQLVLGLDHCLLDRSDCDRLREQAGRAAGVAAADVRVCMSHTHAAGWMSRSRSHLPGGELIAPYLYAMTQACCRAAAEAANVAGPATIVYGTERCSLASHRDYRDPATGQAVCGYNPDGFADDTVLVAKAVAEDGRTLGTVVNYACHPTTLAWENTLISPDYVGAMREVVEGQTGAPCLFLQGASGDLGPREGFVGDPAVADRNGRQLGFAALAAMEAMPPPATSFTYTGPVVSGTLLGTWQHRPAASAFQEESRLWRVRDFTVELPYRPDLPSVETTQAELARWEAEEARALSADDAARRAECRARAEQMTRQLARLASLPPGPAYPLPVTVSRLGQALWVFTPGELYQQFQTVLRERSRPLALVIATITNDWQPGYVPAAGAYGQGIYQEVISAVARGSLEALIEALSPEVEQLR